MGLDIEKQNEVQAPRGRFYVVPERLYKTKDGEIVPQGHPEANSLFKSAGSKVLMSEAIALGLVEEEPVKPAQTKKAAKPKDKQGKTPRNKGRGKK